MAVARFRMKTLTVAIERHGADTKLLQIPAETAVIVLGELSESNRLVDVDWNGRIVMMFTRDLLERAERITG